MDEVDGISVKKNPENGVIYESSTTTSTKLEKRDGFHHHHHNVLADNKMQEIPVQDIEEDYSLSGATLPVRDAPDNVKNVAREMAMDIVQHEANNNSSLSRERCRYSKTLKRTVDELAQRHEILFNSIVSRLLITRENVLDTFSNVANEIFSDRQFNWGRLVSVYAFAGRLAKYCAEKDMLDYVDKVGACAGDFVADHLAWWVHGKGGWDAFDEYFPEPNNFEDKLWKGLLYTAVGLGALATMVAAR